MQIQTLFIFREVDRPLSVGQEIIGQGFRRYRITVKQIIDTKPIGDKVQWKIRATREAMPDEE